MVPVIKEEKQRETQITGLGSLQQEPQSPVGSLRFAHRTRRHPIGALLHTSRYNTNPC